MILSRLCRISRICQSLRPFRDHGQRCFSGADGTPATPGHGNFGGFELVVLGTASGRPSIKRGLSSTALRLEGHTFLFDAGEGSQTQLMRAHVRFSSISNVFVTHLHLDHVGGLAGLLNAVHHARAAGGEGGIDVFGPVGLRQLLRTTERVTGLMPPDDAEKVRVHELLPPTGSSQPSSSARHGERNIASSGGNVWELMDDGRYSVTASPLLHRKVPCFGYVVTERDFRGRLDVERLDRLGVPRGRLLSQIKRNEIETFTAPDGTAFNSSDFVLSSTKGRKAVILGDTCDSSAIAESARDCDVLQHEATLPDALRDQATSFGHSTPKMAALFAQEVGAKRLVLTHFGSRWGDFADVPEVPVGEDDDDHVAHRVASGHRSALVPQSMSIAAQPSLLAKYFDGEVIIASDLCRIKVNRTVYYSPSSGERCDA